MAQMRGCADAYVRLASVARGAIEPKGAAGTAQGIFWKSPLPSACRRGTMAPDCQTKPIRSRLEGLGPGRVYELARKEGTVAFRRLRSWSAPVLWRFGIEHRK